MNSRVLLLSLAFLSLPLLARAQNRQQATPGANANIQQILEFQRQYQSTSKAFARSGAAVTYTPSPLENMLNSLVQEVVALRRDNDALRAELDILKASVKEAQDKQAKPAKASK
jgi:hypothetical protein